MDSGRWATFDCYGTLIDWNSGVSAALAGVFGADADVPRLLQRYHQIEPEIQAERYRRYREVLDLCLAGLALDEGRMLGDGDAYALSESLASWPAFPEVPASLAELKRRGWSRDPIQLRPRPDRAVAAAAGHAVRPRDRGRGRGVVQAAAR